MLSPPSELVPFVVLGFAAGAVAFTASLAKISAPPRVWLAKQKGAFGGWLFDLVSCPFCLSVWLCGAAEAVYRLRLVTLWWPLDGLVTALAMTIPAMAAVAVIKAAIR